MGDTHPSDDQLRDLVAGRQLDESLLETLTAHLTHCPQCEEKASLLEPSTLELRLRNNVTAELGTIAPRLATGYKIEKQVGAGASGIVYQATQTALGRQVALKMLHSGQSPKPSELARFRREADALSRLSHPNIVQVLDVGDQDSRPFLAMEWVDGVTLADRLRQRPLTNREAAEVAVVLARAVVHAHQHGVLHRDLKPGNILIANVEDSCLELAGSKQPLSERLKIVDFGLATLADQEGFHTRTGESLGTPAYMAPEQVNAQKDAIGEPTDVYGLGAILYECLTGRPPFHGSTPLATMQMVERRDAVAVSELNPGVPRDLAVICHRCLAKDPTSRFDTVSALAEDLERYLTNRPIVSRPANLVERSWRWMRRNPWPVSVAMLFLAAVGSVLLAQWSYQSRLAQSRDASVSNYQAARETVWSMLRAAEKEKRVRHTEAQCIAGRSNSIFRFALRISG